VPVPQFPAVFLALSAWPVLIGGGIYLAFVKRLRKWRWLGFALLWFILALFPVVTMGLNTPMAEHRVVLASVGPAVALGWFLAGIPKRILRHLVTLGWFATLVVLSFIQSIPWRSQVSLWEHEAKLHPRSYRAWNFLSLARHESGDTEGAVEAIEFALELSPRHPILLALAARLEMDRGNLEAARAYVTRGLALEQRYLPLHLVETERLAVTGQLERALEQALIGVRVGPRSSGAWNALGNVRFLLNDPEAISSYRRALELDPGNQEAGINLQRALERWRQ